MAEKRVIPPAAPCYESNVFWGCASVCLASASLGAAFGMNSNLLPAHICFIVAWPFGVMVCKCALSSQKVWKPQKTVLSTVALAAALYGSDHASVKTPRGHLHVVAASLIQAKVGLPLAAEVRVVNDGDSVITKASLYRDTNVSDFTPDDISRQHEQQDFFFSEAVGHLDENTRGVPNYLPIHTEAQYAWKTKEPLTSEAQLALETGNSAIYVAGRVLYSDQRGKSWHTDFCMYWQKEIVGRSMRACNFHNEEP